MDVLVDSDRVIAGGVECRPVPGEANAWTYLSTAPWPQLTPAGEPMGSFFDVGGVAMAQLSCQLDPPGHVLEAVRTRLRAQGADGRDVSMRSEVVEVTAVEVVMIDADTGPVGRVIATSNSSGFPPQTAIFQLSLHGDDADVTSRAMAGEAGLLLVRYRLRAGHRTHGVTTVEADVGEWFADGGAVRLHAARTSDPPSETPPSETPDSERPPAAQEDEPC